MTHRHLLPEEIDQLLDDEEGFEVASLRTRLEECPGCQSRLRSLQRVVTSLECLPALAPSPLFSSRVMSQVQVFEPWHVALRDRLTALAPRTTGGRVAFGVAGGVVATAMTFASAWVLQRADAVVFLAGLVTLRTREAVASGADAMLWALLGEAAAGSVRAAGSVALVGTFVVGALALAGVAYGVKVAATAGRRRRE